jgi:hypothetical protein
LVAIFRDGGGGILLGHLEISRGGKQLYACLVVGGLGDGITAPADSDREDSAEEFVVIDEPPSRPGSLGSLDG